MAWLETLIAFYDSLSILGDVFGQRNRYLYAIFDVLSMVYLLKHQSSYDVGNYWRRRKVTSRAVPIDEQALWLLLFGWFY